jgi:4-amino-4-deoxy-L-arabinose transferase-like glycosyltransferase
MENMHLHIKLKEIHNYVLALILLAYIVAVSAQLSRGHDWGDDFASYIMQAKSIVTGTENIFSEQNSFTIHDSSYLIGPVAYPWGYPLFLTIFYAVFGLNPLALKIPNILFFVLFLIVLYKLLKKRLSPWDSILLVSILAFNPGLFSFQNEILSDIPFLFFSTLSVFLIYRFVCENKNSPPSLINNIILGVSIFMTIFVRTAGIVLIFTLFFGQIIVILHQWKDIIKRPRIFLNYLLPYFVVGSLWLVNAVILPSGESTYLLQFSPSNFIRSLAHNILYYSHLLEEFLTGLPSVEILYGFLLAFLLIGLIARSKKDYIFIIYSVFTIGLYLVWPSDQGLRFMFPIIPFFIYFSFQGMKIGFSSLDENYRKAGIAISYLFWIVVLIVFISISGKLIQANLETNRQVSGPFDTYSAEMFSFIRTNTPSSSVVVFFKPRAMHLLTDRNAIMIDNCYELARGDYVVLVKPNSEEQISVDQIGSCGLRTLQEFENNNFIVYKLGK